MEPLLLLRYPRAPSWVLLLGEFEDISYVLESREVEMGTPVRLKRFMLNECLGHCCVGLIDALE